MFDNSRFRFITHLSSTGYSIIDESENVLAYGTICSKAKYEDAVRMHTIASEIGKLIKEYNVNIVVLENSFFGKNPNTGLKLARLCGSVFYVCIENKVIIEMIAPTTVRKVLIGDGKAKKEQIANYIRENKIDVGEYSDKENKTNGIKKTSDLYDSLALVFSYLKKYILDRKYNK